MDAKYNIDLQYITSFISPANIAILITVQSLFSALKPTNS